MAYNLNKIEGSTRTEAQTDSLFEIGTIMVNGELFRVQDMEEMTEHFLMYNQMVKTINEPISEKLIKETIIT